MNIQAAIKSGRPFRLPNWYEGAPENKYYIKPDESNNIAIIGPNQSIVCANDLLSSCWEIDDDITINANEFVDTIKTVMIKKMNERNLVYEPEQEFNRLLVESIMEYWRALRDKNG